jgi:RHS repeat-associated protein
LYVSNETPNIDVFFDNLQVTHIRGPILEETHYYPFGLTMAGISSTSANTPENKLKYNGIELVNDLDIQTYDAFFRELDPQTGRWWQIDPVTDGYENISPYASMYDNPISYSDPLGDEGQGCCKALLDAVEDVLISASGVVNGTLNTASGGIFPSDPFKFRNKLSGEKLLLYDNSVAVGQLTPVLFSNGRGPVRTPSLQPAMGPAIPTPIVLKPTIVPPAQVNAEHKKNARKSTEQTHQTGQARNKQDREGSKGMVNPPRRKPPGHKGPWPPKKSKPVLKPKPSSNND